MRTLFLAVTWLIVLLAASTAHAQTSPQTNQSLPPGGAIVLGPFGPAGSPVTVAGTPTVAIGEATLSDGKKQIIYQAPLAIDKHQDVTLSFKLVGDAEAAAPRKIVVRVDPNFSMAKVSATSAALSWLFVLLIVALFIEGAVLVLVSLLRLIRRKVDIKPSVYKPAYALGLSLLVVVAFPFDPLNDILTAFEGTEPSVLLPQLTPLVDPIITALLLAGGAETVRRIAVGIQKGFGVPNAQALDKEAEEAETPG